MPVFWSRSESSTGSDQSDPQQNNNAMMMTLRESSARTQVPVSKCSAANSSGSGGCSNNPDLYPVHTASFNLREVIKNMLLLEDHLFHPKKRCVECISKHFLLIEGLAEEAVTLQADDKSVPKAMKLLAEHIRKVHAEYLARHESDSTNVAVAGNIRTVRKYLMRVAGFTA